MDKKFTGQIYLSMVGCIRGVTNRNTAACNHSANIKNNKIYNNHLFRWNSGGKAVKYILSTILVLTIFLSVKGQSESHKPRTKDTTIIENSGNGPQDASRYPTSWLVRITLADSTDPT